MTQTLLCYGNLQCFGRTWAQAAQAQELLLGLLKHEPEHRLSLDDVIEHPWLSAIWATSGENEEPGDAEDRPEPGNKIWCYVEVEFS